MPKSASVHMARTSKYQAQNTAIPAAQKEWRAGLYIRLSREDGDKIESDSVSSQRAMLEKFVADNEFLNLTDYYVDDGWSGTDFERPAFKKMMSDLTAKKINCVIVKDLSRFGRNYIEAGKYLETVFPLLKVRFIAVNDMIDSVSNPQSMNTVIVPFKNILNDEYCRDISMKVRSALDIRRRQGKFIGSFAAYGYKKCETDHNKLVIDEEAAQVVRQIFSLFLSGNSIIGIARILNGRGVSNPSEYKRGKGLNCAKGSGFWVDSTVRRILTNELYIGNLVQKKNQTVSYKVHLSKSVQTSERITVERTHEAIISKEDFEKVRNLLSRDTRVSPKSGRLSLFAGFVKCADCRRAMVRRTVIQPYKTYEYYICSTYRKMNSKACTKHAIRADALEEVVLTVLNKYVSVAVDYDRLSEKIKSADRANDAMQRFKAELAAKQAEIAKAQNLLTDIYPDFKAGIISKAQYFALKEKYENMAARAEDAAEQIRREMERYSNGPDGNDGFVKSLKKYNGLQKLTREIVVELIDNIFISEGGGVEIHFKFKDAFLSAREFVEKGGFEYKAENLQ